MKCDLIVIGGGPTGLWAAKKAADSGLDVVVLEEHTAIGLPKHCSGWLMGCEFTRTLFRLLEHRIPHQRVSRMVVRDIFSGRVKEEIEDSGWGGYLVPRDLFEKELARLAVISGAKLFLNVRATELLREDNIVVGVKTSSRRLAEVRAPVTICADGKTSATTRGFARREIAPETECETYTGLLAELAGVSGVRPGEIEIFESDDPATRRSSFWPHAGLTVTTFDSVDELYQMKSKGDNIFSSKLASAWPIYMNAFANRKVMGYYYHCLAKDGILFAGDASGGAGIIHGMITASYGAAVARKAIDAADATLKTLGEYQSVLEECDVHRTPFCYGNIRNHYGLWRVWLERSGQISE